jgi:hypothetical protein
MKIKMSNIVVIAFAAEGFDVVSGGGKAVTPGQSPGNLLTRSLHTRGLQQVIKRTRDASGAELSRIKPTTDSEACHSRAVVELIVRQAHDKLRDTSGQALSSRTYASVVHDGGRSR